ncbi:uncharacterized protein M6G45_004329 [Spheniscus humboldti]
MAAAAAGEDEGYRSSAGKEWCLQKPLQKEGVWPGVIYGSNGGCFFFPSPRGHSENTVVRSSPGDAIDCIQLRLAPQQVTSPTCTAGSVWITSSMVEDSQATGVTEGEGRREGDKKCLNWQILLAAPRAKAAVEESQATRVREKEGRRAGEASELANSPGSTESESCVSCTLLLVFGGLRLCPAARCSRS